MERDVDGAPIGSDMEIEEQDEGEVLVLKIQCLTQQLRVYEEKLKASLVVSPVDSSNDISKPSDDTSKPSDPQDGMGVSQILEEIHSLSGRTASLGTAATSQGDSTWAPEPESPADAEANVEVYELLEEKHRLSRRISARRATSALVSPGGPAERPDAEADLEVYQLLEEKLCLSGRTTSLGTAATSQGGNSFKDDETHPMTDEGSRMTSLSSVRSIHEQVLSKGKDDLSNIEKTTLEQQTPLSITAMGNGSDRDREDSQPGAVSINGIASSRGVTFQEIITEDDTVIERARDSNAKDGDMLVEANLVDEEAGAGPIFIAKRESWYRRNQGWLVGAGVLTTAAIVLIIIFTTVDLSPAPAPTMAPTTQAQGVEADTEALVISAFPAAAGGLADGKNTTQSKALRWIAGRRFKDPSQYSDIQVLQQYALAALFFGSLGASAWTQNEGWLNKTNECDWHGVECTTMANGSKGMVVSICLPGHNVGGSIPSDLSILSSSLSKLDLSDNQMTGTIPSEIGLLTSLTLVSLKSNKLVGRIPFSIGTLLSLESLDIGFNKLGGEIPQDIGKLSMLRVLDIRNNNFVEALPSEIGQLTRLEYINLESNKLSSTIPSEIGFLTALEMLSARHNSFVRSLPNDVGSLKALRTLDLSENLIDGSIPSQITFLTKLEYVDLSFNEFSGMVPYNIGVLRAMTTLSLADNSLETVFPPSLGLAVNLVHLDLSGNALQFGFGKVSNVPSELSRLSNLVTLDLGGMEFSTNPMGLISLTKLEVLGVSDTNILDFNVLYNEGFDFFSVVLRLHALREIYVANSFGAPYSTIPEDVQYLSNLEVLDLEGNSILGTLPTQLGLLTRLSILNFRGNLLSGTVPSEIYRLTNLRDLILAGESVDYRSDLEGSILPSIGQLTKLHRLDIGFSSMTGRIPSEIGLTQLEELTMVESSITGSIPPEIRFLVNLRVLDLHASALSGPVASIDFSEFEVLEKLDLSSTMLSGAIVPDLWSRTRLRMVDMSNTTIFGSIPSGVSNLSSLSLLRLSGVNMTGSSLPSEMGSCQNLQVLDLTGAGLVGTIPSELFRCTKLMELRLEGNGFDGSIPSEIGLSTNLLVIELSGNAITGKIPIEIGNIILLKNLDLSRTSLTGTIPIELTSQLPLLSVLNLGSTSISGGIPIHLTRLANLEFLSLSGTNGAGSTIPTEISYLSKLGMMNISFASIGGTVPLELTLIEELGLIDFRGNKLTGSFHDICGFIEFSDPRTGVWAHIRTAYIDCDELECSCCECFPTVAPSLSFQPSTSISPTNAPSATVLPSASVFPSRGIRQCESFLSIAEIGTPLLTNDLDDGYISFVSLPFIFNWRGQEAYDTVSVDADGIIYFFLEDCNVFLDDCNSSPKIVLTGLVDLDIKLPANIYSALVGDAFIVSFEGVDIYQATSGDFNLYFQAALYEDGSIEIRWGESLKSSTFSIRPGLSDSFANYCVSGFPFDGDSSLGDHEWPTNQCRGFILTEMGEYEDPTPVSTPSPTTSMAPTAPTKCELFSTMIAVGTPILPTFFRNDVLANITLPFIFKWRGKVEYSAITVSTNGVVFLGDKIDGNCDTCVFDPPQACCEAFPIGNFTDSGYPRIAVAQENLRSDFPAGEIYFAELGNDAVVISYEGLGFQEKQGGERESPILYFQVVLYSDGRIEMRWGRGRVQPNHPIVAGLEDDGLTVPATGYPFEVGGVVAPEQTWPENQCRMFTPTDNGGYTEEIEILQ